MKRPHGSPPLPWPARWLARMSPVAQERQDDVQADLLELFAARRSARGLLRAHWRLYCDVASLWVRPPQPGAAPSLLALLRDARADLRYAARLFLRQPAILLLTIVGLSLGLGIATAAFSIMNAAALRGEGLVDPDGAPGVLKATETSVSTAWPYDEYLMLRGGATRMQVEAVLSDSVPAGPEPAQHDGPSVGVAFVSGGFFAATGGRVTLGRSLVSADEQWQGPPPAVVSNAFWSSRLQRDPAAVGRAIRIGRAEATIVGVAERGFSLPHNRMLWLPLTAYGAVYGSETGRRAPDNGIEVFGRLLPDVTLPDAEAQLGGVAAALPGGPPAGESIPRVRLDPHAGLGRVSASDTLAIAVFVFAVIALVLLLACANVATVLISTAITRDREMGVRAALGASRGRIVRQLVTESLALGAIASGVGLVLAHWAIPMIGRMIEAPAGTDLSPDPNVYLFLGAVTLLTGVGAGLAPAWHGRGADLVTPLKGDGGPSNRVAPRRLRFLLIMTQAAVSVLLIVMATLFVRATFRAAAIDVGFDAAGLYTVSPGVGDAFNDESAASRVRSFCARAMPELQTVPGISAVSLVEMTPFGDITRSAIAGDGPNERVIYFNRTGAGYFETVGLRLLAGRIYTPDEAATRAPVAVVSQSLARAWWRDRSPLGEMLPQEIPIPAIPPASSARPVIIGVVADAIAARLHERSPFAVYEPLDPESSGLAHLMFRAAPGATGAVQQASQRLRAIDPQADVRIASVSSRLRQEAGRPRMLAMLTGVVGFIAIVLCVIGLYGLTASVVGQRAREMGVRVALGAKPGDLLRLLMWDSLRPVMLGLAAGAGAALLASRLLAAAMFFGVSPRDPVAFAGAAVTLLAAAILAVLLPARRAASVDAARVLTRS